MEQQKAIKPAALEALVETLKADYRHLMVSMNRSWNKPRQNIVYISGE
jgi:hypothetical protein